MARVEVTPQEAAEKLALAAQEMGESVEQTRRMVEKRDRDTDEAIANIEAQIDEIKDKLRQATGARV